MIIADTNVISEWIKPTPARNVVRWMRLTPSDQIYATAISEAEMRYGVATEAEGQRRHEREALIDQLFSVRFAGRVLAFDSDAAKAFAIILAQMRRRGRTFSKSDAQIAAIAAVHGAAVATRDAGFEHSGVPLIDPWNS
jgi:toxin FitB